MKDRVNAKNKINKSQRDGKILSCLSTSSYNINQLIVLG